MIVRCDKCGTQYNLDDAKVRPGETKVRCSRCQYVFIISPPPLPLDAGEIFGEKGQQNEDAFMKEWAQEFTPSSAQERRQPAPPASDKAPPPRAFVPPTGEETLFGEEAPAKVSARQPLPERRQPTPPASDKAPPPRAFFPATTEEALFGEEAQPEEKAAPEEEVSPFKIRPMTAAPREKERKVSTTFLLTMLLLVVIVGAFYYWNERGHSISAFEYIYEKIYDFMGGKKEQKLFLLYLKGSEHTLGGGKVFVVQGKVANRSPETKKFVKVKGSLFDKTGKVVATSVGYCGITINDEEIQKSTYDALKSSFGFPAVGQAKPVPAQQSLPFTIIFFSPPEGASQYQVELAEASESE